MVDLPSKNGGIFNSYLSLLEGTIGFGFSMEGRSRCSTLNLISWHGSGMMDGPLDLGHRLARFGSGDVPILDTRYFSRSESCPNAIMSDL